MRKVIFVINGTTFHDTGILSGSEAMRGVQPAKQLNVELKTNSEIEYEKIKDSILVFIGDLSITYKLTKEKILSLQSRNNIIIQDPVDALCFVTPWEGYRSSSTEEYNCLSVVDSIITPNSVALENLKSIVKEKCILKTILHNWDNRFENVGEKPNDFTTGYCGVTNGIPQEFANFNLDCYRFTDIGPLENKVKAIQDHFKASHSSINFRKSNMIEFIMKPPMKVATSAFFGAPLITTKDYGNYDLLPEDYPLFIDEDFDSLIEKIEYCKYIFKRKEWLDLLDLFKEIKKKTSIEYLSNQYIELFKEFNWERK